MTETTMTSHKSSLKLVFFYIVIRRGAVLKDNCDALLILMQLKAQRAFLKLALESYHILPKTAFKDPFQISAY